ncbi:hypothetical protein ACQJBY_068429 [Aegilops geniculata]
MAFPLRSISLPSRPHISEAEVEQELLSLEASISSSITIGTMCEGLMRLGNIYNGVEEIIGLPSNQVCSAQERKMLDGEMEGSLELLDLCSTMQEIFVEMKAIIQELQVALRKGDEAASQAKIQSYTLLTKKAKKHFKKTAKKATSEGCSMVMLLSKAREVSYLQGKLSKQIEMRKQSLISKANCQSKLKCANSLLSPRHFTRRRSQLFVRRSNCRS